MARNSTYMPRNTVGAAGEGMVFKAFGLVKGMIFKSFGLVKGPV